MITNIPFLRVQKSARQTINKYKTKTNCDPHGIRQAIDKSNILAIAGAAGALNISMSEQIKVGKVDPKNKKTFEKYEDCVERLKLNWDSEVEYKEIIDAE